PLTPALGGIVGPPRPWPRAGDVSSIIHHHPCSGFSRSAATMHDVAESPPHVFEPGPAPHKDMVWIPGGTFRMGSDNHYPEEAPAHDVTVDGFWIDQHPVTNAEFRRFSKDTGYVTSAERAPNPEDYPGAKRELLVPSSVVF